MKSSGWGEERGGRGVVRGGSSDGSDLAWSQGRNGGGAEGSVELSV